MDIVGKSKEDVSLPKATMFKIIKEMLPPDVRVARDAQDLLVECCVEFINLISSESNEVCSREEKRTIAPEHVLKALQVDYYPWRHAPLRHAERFPIPMRPIIGRREKKQNDFKQPGERYRSWALDRQDRFVQRWVEVMSHPKVSYELRSIWVLYMAKVLGFSEYIGEVYAAYEQHKLDTLDSPKGGKFNGAEMTEEEALAAQQKMFAEARARMNNGVDNMQKQSDSDRSLES